MLLHNRLSKTRVRRDHDGLEFRNVSRREVEAAMEGDMNMFNGMKYSQRYSEILEGRRRLPVFARMGEFYDMFQTNQVVILEGQTGSGKTIQIPQFVAYADLPHVTHKTVACTQPRRVAATSVAKRVAEEMDVDLGKEVGYAIRFEDVTTAGKTIVKYVTDGMLLREAMDDPLLSRYSTICVDEAHERTLSTDMLLGILKTIIKTRADLKVIVMSATLDAAKFQHYFGGAPLLRIPGGTFPVQILWSPSPVTDYAEGAIETSLDIHRTEGPGDILVFLTGQEEIESAVRKISRGADSGLIAMPLYSGLSPEMQARIFEPAPAGKRKVVVATNVAETSLTIEGIVYVVDAGFVKQRIYNPRTRVESLLPTPISRASAQQRAGRAGRTQPGKCYRLYTEHAFVHELEEQTYPEILRVNLATTVLELMKLGVRDLVRFDYVDSPAPETLMRALESLNFLGALDDEGELTTLGGMMAEFPLEPQLAKALLESPTFGCSNEILTIVAMLSVPNVFVQPAQQQFEARAAHALLSVPDGDHLTLLNVYNQYKLNERDPNWAWDNFLSARSLAQADNVRAQLVKTMERFDLPVVSSANIARLHTQVRKALTAGFFMQVAHKRGRTYVTVKDNQHVVLHPACTLETEPDWVIFNEFVLTSRQYIRTATAIEPEWLMKYAIKYYDLRTFSDDETKRALLQVGRRRKLGLFRSGPSGN